MSETSVTIIGSLTRDPELKSIGNNNSVASFSVAVNSKKGEEEYTSFFDCEVWGALAQNFADSCHKGDRVIVQGTLKQDRYEKDGQKRSAVILKANAVGPDLRWSIANVTKSVGRGPNSTVNKSRVEEEAF
jgi:single-strand DNA-binding protein